MSADNLQFIVNRLVNNLKRDVVVQKHVHDLRESLNTDRVVLYYFYRQWQGQVTYEALKSDDLSILGSTGPDECFNDEYATLYQAGRIKATADIETEPIHQCHRNFLRTLKVRANLVAPILIPKGLWGLLIAQECKHPRQWSATDLKTIEQEAQAIASVPIIQNSY